MRRIRWGVVLAATLAVLVAGSRATTAQFEFSNFLYLPLVSQIPEGYPTAPALSSVLLAWNRVRLSWDSVPDAKAYRLWQSDNPAMIGAVTVYSGKETRFDMALPEGAFYFTVQAANDNGAQASDVLEVDVIAPTPVPTATPEPVPTATPVPADVCSAIPGASYGSLSVNGPPTDRPAENHPDLNLAIRSYEFTNLSPDLVDLNGGSDSNAPQLPVLFSDRRTPAFAASYKVYDWNWGTDQRGGLIGNPEVTLLGMQTTPGETIGVPNSGYNIGQGYQAFVLYASDTRLTLKYTRDDNVVHGYTVHLENVCPEPSLLALYRQLNSQGRGRLPALKGGQLLGRAAGGEIRAAVRDNGSFMDPRSRKDWWQGVPLGR